MSPTHTHGRLRSRLMAHLAWSLVVVKSSSTSTKSISSTFSTMKGPEQREGILPGPLGQLSTSSGTPRLGATRSAYRSFPNLVHLANT